MKHFFALLASCWSLLWSVTAFAEPVRIAGARIELGEVLSEIPEELAWIDLGPAPPPGKTRVLTRQALEEAITKAGGTPRALNLPASIRVVRPAEYWSSAEFAKRARPALEQALRPGVRLQDVIALLPLTVAEGSQVGRAILNEPPRRPGLVRATAMVEIIEDEVIAKRIPITLALYVDEQGARRDVQRGDGVTLSIRQRAAVISALAEALADGDVGDTISFRIKRTGKVLKAVLETPTTARVLPSP